ncbi:Uncharacterised protein [uncultured Comamonas sp.]|nr:Uncharacterised protein [uncultured Comamonas sp.]
MGWVAPLWWWRGINYRSRHAGHFVISMKIFSVLFTRTQHPSILLDSFQKKSFFCYQNIDFIR